MSKLQFKNSKFRIMQIADCQERLPVNPDTLKLIDLAVRKEMPDLIVFTGDQIAGYYPCFKKDTEKTISYIISLVTKTADELNIPYCITFGNHDSDSGMSNRLQTEKIYSKLPGYVSGKYRNDDDTGTYSLQIKDSNGKENILNLYLFDSNKKGKDGTYLPVSEAQVQWYKEERERLKEENGKYLPSLVFQHIPIPEYFNILKLSSKKQKGSVEAFEDHKDEYYVLDDEMLKQGHFMYESPATPVINTGEFAAFKQKDDVLGVFCGHDHNNSFVGNYEGIMLGYCQGCGFNTYGPGDKRGVRVFDFDENDIRNFKTHTVTMADFGKYKPSEPILEFILMHMPSSVNEAKHKLKNALAVGLGVGALAAGVAYISKKVGR